MAESPVAVISVGSESKRVNASDGRAVTVTDGLTDTADGTDNTRPNVPGFFGGQAQGIGAERHVAVGYTGRAAG